MTELLADPHTHSTLSDGMMDIQERHRRASQTQVLTETGRFVPLSVYGATDHDRPFNEFRDQLNGGISVINGAEITTGIGHFLVYAFPGERIPKTPMGRSLEDTVRWADDNGLVKVIPHMNFGGPPGSIPQGAIYRLYERGFGVDGIEVANANFRLKHIKQAGRVAALLAASPVGTSDSHLLDLGYKYLTAYPESDKDPVTGYLNALREGSTRWTVSFSKESSVPLGRQLHRQARSLIVGLDAKLAQRDRFAATLIEYIADCMLDFIDNYQAKNNPLRSGC